MARSTRQQRRQRRAQLREPRRCSPRLGLARRPRRSRRSRPPSRAPSASDEVRSGVPGVRFIQECWAELKKVEWPNQQQLISGTAVVLVACLITGLYLYANDRLWEYVVKHLLLR